MIHIAPVRILGGLVLMAEVDFPVYQTFGVDPSGWNPDPSVNCLYWQRRDGSIGNPVSDNVMEKIRRKDYWDADVIEQVSDALAHEKWLNELPL